jgi:hypothetical protein
MKSKVKWIVLGVLCLVSFVLTFMKAPEAIASMLEMVAREAKTYATFVHLLFLAALALGLLVRRLRNLLFSLFISFISLSAAVFGVAYVIAPNVILFATFFLLILRAWLNGKLNFALGTAAPVSLFFGVLGLVFGFWYLHWVESPVWLNALFASPLGVVNCPTMVTVCGFLCLSQKPRSALLEAAVGIVTLYFGFFGIFRLGAYVDVVLVLCALFLLMRLIASSRHAHASEESVAFAAARP